MTDLTPEAERTALEDMLQSEGWAIFTAHMDKAWGADAFEHHIDTELKKEGDPMNEIAITRRIRDTFKGVRASLKWPKDRIDVLKQAPGHTLMDQFAHLRRGPKRA